MITISDDEILVAFTPATGVPMLMRVAHTDDDRAIVRFYDRRRSGTEWGQFIASYYLSSLLEVRPGNGLMLQGRVPMWDIDFVTFGRLMRIAREAF